MEQLTKLISPSGDFFIDKAGLLIDFVSADINPLIESNKYPYKSIKTLLVPEGVKFLPDGFMLGVQVTEQIIFPSTLENFEEGCFMHSQLPEVTIPESVHKIGAGAFLGSQIRRLIFKEPISSLYGRQFKESKIGELVIPKAMKDSPYFVQAEVGMLTIVE